MVSALTPEGWRPAYPERQHFAAVTRMRTSWQAHLQLDARICGGRIGQA
jgi:hypothetical protein